MITTMRDLHTASSQPGSQDIHVMDAWTHTGLHVQKRCHVIKLHLSLGHHLFNYQSCIFKKTSFAINPGIFLLSWTGDVFFLWNHQDLPSFSQPAPLCNPIKHCQVFTEPIQYINMIWSKTYNSPVHSGWLLPLALPALPSLPAVFLHKRAHIHLPLLREFKHLQKMFIVLSLAGMGTSEESPQVYIVSVQILLPLSSS